MGSDVLGHLRTSADKRNVRIILDIPVSECIITLSE